MHNILLDIHPYGQMRMTGDDAISVFEANWAKLWPEVRRELESMCEYSGRLDDLKITNWTAEGSWLEPDVFMSDQADLYLRIRLADYPVWDFFLNGDKIVHCQAVY